MLTCPVCARVARQESSFGAQIVPNGWDVRERNTPIRVFLVDMGLVAEQYVPSGDLVRYPLWNCPLCSNVIFEFKWRNGGRRWEESNVETSGFGMREAIFDAGTNFVVPALNWMRYCGEVVESMGMSMTVPDQRMALLLELGSMF